MKRNIIALLLFSILIGFGNLCSANKGACYITIEKPSGTVIERTCDDGLDNYTCTNFVESFLKKNIKDRKAKIDYWWVEGKRCIDLGVFG